MASAIRDKIRKREKGNNINGGGNIKGLKQAKGKEWWEK